MAWVYILKDDSDHCYVGSTIDLDARIKHHKSGHSPATKHFSDPYLALSQEYDTLSEARKVENKLKSFKRRDYIEKIISDGYIKTDS